MRCTLCPESQALTFLLLAEEYQVRRLRALEISEAEFFLV
jgi:hypothetical protein